MEYKITLARAKEILRPFAYPRGSESVKLEDAYKRVLAKDYTASENIPAFDRSAADGYALNSAITTEASQDAPKVLKVPEEAVAINAGEPIPESADAIAGFGSFSGFAFDSATLTEPISAGANITHTGSYVKSGELIAAKGEIVTPEIAGTLAGQGITEIEVYLRPRIGIISIGDEIISGQVRDSNRYTLEFALRDCGCIPFWLGLAEDVTQDIAHYINSGRGLDAMISTGGSAYGNNDFITSAFDAMGAFSLCWGGTGEEWGTFAFATLGITPLICLSGEPRKMFSTLNEIVIPALRQFAGFKA
ncbi:MAG: hypothetical protein LBT88_03670 [Oscillospiraceae bacterium]|jgi:molybdopterin molybdotransferase|nr:hypothetical protein [Oscillospiraceae bacterium]